MACAVAALSLATYLATMGSGPFWQDAGLFLAGARLGGGLAPPGYPVWLLLARPFLAAWHLLFPAHSFARAVHVFDAVWAALAAGLVCLVVAEVTAPGFRFLQGTEPARTDAGEARRPRRRKHADKAAPAAARVTPAPPAAPAWVRLSAAGLAGVMAGWSYSLWSQAINAEAYALNGLFAMLTLYCLVRAGAEGPLLAPLSGPPRRWLLATAFVHGLSCGNHPDTAVFVPVFAWLAWTQRSALRDRRFVVTWAAVWVGAALLPYAYLPWLAARQPEALYDDVRDLAGFVAHVTGSQWTGAEESYGWSFDRLLGFPLLLWHELFAVGLVGLAAGLLALGRALRPLLRMLAVFLVTAAALPLLYLQGGEYDMWLIPFHLAGATVAGVGLERLLARARERLGPGRAMAVAAAVAVAGLAPMLVVNAPLLDRRQDHVPEDFARNLYRAVDPGALLLVWSDQECSLSWYAQKVEGLRPDVSTVAAPLLTMRWYRDWVRRQRPDVALPPESAGLAGLTAEELTGRIAEADPRRVVFSTKRPLTSASVAWVPAGTFWKHDPAQPDRIRLSDWAYEYRDPRPFDRPARKHAPLRATDPRTGAPTVVRTPYTHQIRLFHEQGWKNLGDWQLARGDWAGAAEAYRKVVDLDPAIDHAAVLLGLGKALFALGREDDARGWLTRAAVHAAVAAEAELYLGQIDARAGRPADAATHFAAARRLGPGLWQANEPALRAAGLVP